MDPGFSPLILLIGGILVLTLLTRAVLEREGLPAQLGYVLIGFGIRLFDGWHGIDERYVEILLFLADVGIIALLFRIGLKSRVRRLVRRFPSAVRIWASDFIISGGIGFAAVHLLIGWGLIPSLFVGAALSATSVGVAANVWQEFGRLRTPDGALLLDVAELDDVSGAILVGLLLALAPALRNGSINPYFPEVATVFVIFVLKIALLAGFCLLFARYLERPITAFFEDLFPDRTTILVVLGIGLMVAAVAGMLGFSIAIGAFIAGLIFSQDPDAVLFDTAFESLYNLFVPFFFIGVGLQIQPDTLIDESGSVGILLLAALVGKGIGSGLPARMSMETPSALMFGLSMVPRTEITLVVMQRGLELGTWAVAPPIFSDVVVVVAVTAVVIPFLLRVMFRSRGEELSETGGVTTAGSGASQARSDPQSAE